MLVVMSSSIAASWSALHEHHTIRDHGNIHVHGLTSHFGFQIHALPEGGISSLMFGLLHENSAKGGFAIRLDLASGEIWDIANDSGILGWFGQGLPIRQKSLEPLLLRWEIEHRGGALIPHLQIGDEEWLYPSVHFPAHASYRAITGWNRQTPADTERFTPGCVWCQDRLAR